MKLENIGGKYSGIYTQKLKDGSLSYYISFRNELGKSVRKKIGNSSDGMNKSTALTILNDTKLRIKKSEESEIEISTKTLNELADKYFQDKAISGRTMKGEESGRYGHIKNNDWASREVRKIQKRSINKFILELKNKDLSPATIKKIIDLCRAIVNHSIKSKYYFGHNPFEKIELEKFNNDRTRFLTYAEVELLLNALYGYKDRSGRENDNLYILGVLALNTGARKATLFNIKYRDIDFDTGTVSLYNFKDKVYYTGFIADKEVLRYLQDKSLSEKSATYILNNGNPNKKLSDVPRPFIRILDELFNKDIDDSRDLDKVVFHTLRHTFASLLAQNGVPIFTIKKLMSHKSIESTMRYAKLAPDNGRDEVLKLWEMQEKQKLTADDMATIIELDELNL